jgi:hypothetical protein
MDNEGYCQIGWGKLICRNKLATQTRLVKKLQALQRFLRFVLEFYQAAFLAGVERPSPVFQS